jgi:ribonuclease HI
MIKRNLSTPASRAFWRGVDATAARVDAWPDWMKGVMPKPKVTIYSDGACKGNPGPGGWGYLIMSGEHYKEGSGGEAKTTNNRMEMIGALRALQALRHSCQVTVYTDSQYLCNCFRNGWYKNWKQNGWKTSRGTDVLNKDLWEALLVENERHKVEWKWVKGHSDNEYNNRCDELAVEARLKVEEDAKTKGR